jgi:hypothetical protein
VLGLAPALAQDQPPADDAQTPPAASEQPATPPEAMPSQPSEPSGPAAPAPGDTSEMMPSQPDADLPKASEAPQPDATSPQSSEAPKSIEPAAPKSAEAAGGAQFLSKQESTDYLASNLIGESVYNSQDEVIGDINDLVSDSGGKFVAVLIGTGGFLGLGEKDIAIRFEDLKLTRDENNDVKVVADLSNDMIVSAPDYETLTEQSVAVGASDQRGASGTQ